MGKILITLMAAMTLAPPACFYALVCVSAALRHFRPDVLEGCKLASFSDLRFVKSTGIRMLGLMAYGFIITVATMILVSASA